MDQEDYTLFCGNLNPEVTEELLYELFLQVNLYQLPNPVNQAQPAILFLDAFDWQKRYRSTLSVRYRIDKPGLLGSPTIVSVA